MIRTFIHIGYPKTATTTLQENILYPWHQEKKINYLGIIGFSKDPEITSRFDFLRPLIRGLSKVNVASTPLDEKRKSFEKKFDEQNFNEQNLERSKSFLVGNLVNVLSSESILIPNINLYGYKSIAERLKKILPSDSTKIILTLRAQQSLIPSFYAEKFPHLYHDENYNTPQKAYFNNGKFKEEEFLNIFDFNDAVKTYAEVFGKENIHIYFFENLKENKNYYNQIFSDLFGLSIKEEEKNIKSDNNFRVKDKNAKDEYLVKVSIKHKGLLAQLLKVGQRVPFLNKQLDSLLYKSVSVPTFTKAESDAIFNHFAESNLELAKEYGLDVDFMKKYKYI